MPIIRSIRKLQMVRGSKDCIERVMETYRRMKKSQMVMTLGSLLSHFFEMSNKVYNIDVDVLLKILKKELGLNTEAPAENKSDAKKNRKSAESKSSDAEKNQKSAEYFFDLVDNCMTTYAPGNVFYGPSPELRDKSDDPGCGFESNCEPIIGPHRFRVMQQLYDDMVSLANSQ